MSEWRASRIGTLVQETRRPVVVEPAARYAEIGVRSHGRGTFHKDPVWGAELEEKQVFEVVPGDLVFNIVFAWEGAVAVVDERDRGRVASHRFPTYRARTGVADIRFLRYLLTSSHGQFLLDRNSPGAAGRNRTLDRWSLLREIVMVPPAGAQQRVADFLDRATARIDEVITKKERLATILAEKRQAVIGHLTLPTGVPVGVSWETTRLGYVARIGNGSTPTRDDERYWGDAVDGALPWLNSGRVNDEHITAGDMWVSAVALRECHLPRVPAQSVLVAITGEGQTRGRAALLMEPATISQHLAYVRLLSARVAPSFVWRQLQARYEWLREESAGGGSTRAALTCEFLRTVPLSFPPIEAQHQILGVIDRQCLALDRAIAACRLSVERMREYREAVITAAVTGRIACGDEHDLVERRLHLLESA